MRVLVTGGAGFLGYHLVRRILDEGPTARVLVVDDLSTPGSKFRAERLTAVDPNRVEVVRQDLLDFVPSPLGGRQPFDEVWHLASPASPPLYKARPLDTLRLGGDALDALLAVVRETGGRLVFASTSEVYGDPPEAELQEGALVENMPGRVHCDGPRSMYDEAKRYGEALCAAHRGIGADARVVRIFNTYGPVQKPNDGRLVPRLVFSAATGKPFPLHGSGYQTRTFAYVDDTVAGMFAVGRAEAYPGTTNVGSDLEGERSVLDLVDLVRGLPGAKPFELSALPRQDEHDPRRRLPDLARLRSLGWEPRVGLVDGMSRTLAWMNRHYRG